MKYIITIVLACILSTGIQAQRSNEDDRRERMESRIESQKVAFITQKLNLSPEEAQVFWPIYNEHHAKMKASRNQNIPELSDDASPAEAEAFLAKLLSEEQNELDMKKQYFERLSEAVSATKAAKLYYIEKRFREEVLAKIKSKMGQKRKRRRNADF